MQHFVYVHKSTNDTKKHCEIHDVGTSVYIWEY